MNLDDIRKTLEEHFKSNWVTPKVIWTAAPSDVPNDYWVRFNVIMLDSFNHTFGDNGVKKTGLAVLQAYAPLDKGTGELYRIADTYIAMMANKRFGNLFLYAGSVEPIGESPTTASNAGSGQMRELTTGYYQINVSVPFDAI
ncbi:MAG: hypothetical protein DRQ45_00065 [Gammaproteobacteria bacterium]|nr:MAG: hypothetical protein DRQ45_00065 [Gammaproteobacteria bacterium]